jgi:hypothetical protein
MPAMPEVWHVLSSHEVQQVIAEPGMVVGTHILMFEVNDNIPDLLAADRGRGCRFPLRASFRRQPKRENVLT